MRIKRSHKFIRQSDLKQKPVVCDQLRSKTGRRSLVVKNRCIPPVRHNALFLHSAADSSYNET